MLMDGLKLNYLKVEDQQFLELFTEVTSLSLNSCQLVNLLNLPMLPKLSRLELQDNKLTGVEIPLIVEVYGDTLEILKLSSNLIRDYDLLKPLTEMAEGVLINLDLSNNPINEIIQYRDQIFDLLPQLEILDGLDKEGNEINSENDQECEEYDVGDKHDGGAVMSDDEDDENSDGLERVDGGAFSEGSLDDVGSDSNPTNSQKSDEEEGGQVADQASIRSSSSSSSDSNKESSGSDSSSSSSESDNEKPVLKLKSSDKKSTRQSTENTNTYDADDGYSSGDESMPDPEDAVYQGFEALGEMIDDHEERMQQEEQALTMELIKKHHPKMPMTSTLSTGNSGVFSQLTLGVGDQSSMLSTKSMSPAIGSSGQYNLAGMSVDEAQQLSVISEISRKRVRSGRKKQESLTKGDSGYLRQKIKRTRIY
eukprot:403336952